MRTMTTVELTQDDVLEAAADFILARAGSKLHADGLSVLQAPAKFVVAYYLDPALLREAVTMYARKGLSKPGGPLTSTVEWVLDESNQGDALGQRRIIGAVVQFPMNGGK